MKLKAILILTAVLMVIFVITPVFSQEPPKPGTTIDRNNYKKYATFFPDEFLPVFENGFDGIFQPIHIKVVASEPLPQPKIYVELSAKNKGRYGIDAQGYTTGGWAYDGMPFPDLQRDDKDFAAKMMWNFAARYRVDEADEKVGGNGYEKRKGEDLQLNNSQTIIEVFTNRLVCSPKPMADNPNGLYSAVLVHYRKPDNIKNLMVLSYRYRDQKKADDSWIYLPFLRRTIRVDAGQRSAPIQGSALTLDDMFAFDGIPMDFTYTIVEEQKVLACLDNKLTSVAAKTFKKTELPFAYEGYSLRDAYVVDIKPKNPKYPQSKKRLWVDKENLAPLYAVAWDRAGKLWKFWATAYDKGILPNSDMWPAYRSLFTIDIQYGVATNSVPEPDRNKCKYEYGDFAPSALLKRAR